MPSPSSHPNSIKTFASPQDLGLWLSSHHGTETELWIKIFKKQSGITSITWDEVVIESLCWGWIDGIKKSLDDQAYLQRITPRKKGSNWSKRNTQHVERLINEGRMQEAGLKHVHEAKADGRWQSAYVISEFKVPEDFLAALDSQPKAKQFFNGLNKSNRYVIAYGLASAKKSETRKRRFDKYMAMLINEEKPK